MLLVQKAENQGLVGCYGFSERKTCKICPGVQNVVCQTGVVWSLTECRTIIGRECCWFRRLRIKVLSDVMDFLREKNMQNLPESAQRGMSDGSGVVFDTEKSTGH